MWSRHGLQQKQLGATTCSLFYTLHVVETRVLTGLSGFPTPRRSTHKLSISGGHTSGASGPTAGKLLREGGGGGGRGALFRGAGSNRAASFLRANLFQKLLKIARA